VLHPIVSGASAATGGDAPPEPPSAASWRSKPNFMAACAAFTCAEETNGRVLTTGAAPGAVCTVIVAGLITPVTMS